MTVLIIRHGEKAEDGPHLSKRGQERAAALIGLFQTCFRAPDRLIAAADTEKSSRPRETLEPLAVALNLPVSAETAEVDEIAPALAGAVEGRSVVLVSWRHDAIPALARALGASHVPDEWPEHIYDRIWRLMPTERGEIHVAELRQALLAEDAFT